MKRHFKAGCELERIRNRFGFHYDLDAIVDNANMLLPEQGFEMLYTDTVLNSFYPTSELVTCSSMLYVTQEGELDSAYSTLVRILADRSSDFLDLFNLLIEAFCLHVVDDLEGTLEQVAECDIQTSVKSGEVRYPVFVV
jgi:hypothetical protein